jgi:rhodanese-related sulfurtransferase
MIKTMSPLQVKTKLEQGEIFLIDVREPAEYRTECIESACLIPLQEISIEKIPSKSRPIVIHCHSGRRSALACEKLLAQDENL